MTPDKINHIIRIFDIMTRGDMNNCFLEEHFEILETNLINTNHRKIFEGLLITLRNPVLNKQVAHACMTFLCTCLIPKSGVKPNSSIT